MYCRANARKHRGNPACAKSLQLLATSVHVLRTPMIAKTDAMRVLTWTLSPLPPSAGEGRPNQLCHDTGPQLIQLLQTCQDLHKLKDNLKDPVQRNGDRKGTGNISCQPASSSPYKNKLKSRLICQADDGLATMLSMREPQCSEGKPPKMCFGSSLPT